MLARMSGLLPMENNMENFQKSKIKADIETSNLTS